MRVATAQTPPEAESQDRLLTADRVILILDGASAFEPVDVSTNLYVGHLAGAIEQNLKKRPDSGLSEAVADAIRETARTLDLQPGNAPSSTVSLLRVRENYVDLFCLGDSAIYYGDEDNRVTTLTDLRLAELRILEHQLFRERIAGGSGYDAQHHELLAALQRKQRKWRNRPDGYWIAEADPAAAHHAYTRTVPRDRIAWAVLATDGAYGPILHLGLGDWPRLARQSSTELAQLLDACAKWEMNQDPDGREFPRAKVSDDKALAAVIL